MDTIDSLDLEEQELTAQLNTLRNRRQSLRVKLAEEEKETKRLIELEKEIVIRILSIQGGNLLVESLRREDVLSIWKSTPGQAFKGYSPYEGSNIETPARNLIPIKQWDKTKERLLSLPRLTISWDKEAEEKFEWILNAPPWEVDTTTIRGNLAFKVTAGPDQGMWTTNLNRIPGQSWNYSGAFFDIPMSEGWRIFEKLEGVEGIVYTDTARILIVEQVESRGKLDKIAQAADSDDPRIKKLTHVIINPRTKKEMPFCEALLPFQRAGIEFLLVSGGRTILADKTGLGKTWQMIGFCEVKRMEKPDIQIVCEVKGANIPNWVREIKNLTGEDAVVCNNVEKAKNIAYHRILGERAPYILISHDLLGTYEEEDDGTWGDKKKKFPWADLFQMIEPEILLLDEGHKIKNPDANRTKATRQLATIPFIIPATASPILNRTEELWPLLFMTDPIMFHSQQQFKNHYTWDGRTAKNVDELHEMLRPRFIRRLRKDVQKDLPPINRVTKVVALSEQALKDYKIALEGFYAKLALYDPKGKKGEYYDITNMLVEIGRLKQICAADKVGYVADLAVDLIDQSENGGKVLIFSQYKATANQIARLLGNQAVCTVVRTPDDFRSMNATDRDELFEKARNDDYIKFIVTTEAAQEGHNLEFCDWVIFNDQFWTPAAHEQCEGRAYGRLANPHTIDSFYVIADVKIEEFMQELLERKLAIIEETVEGVESTRDLSGSIATELIKRMKEEMYRR